MAPTICSGKKCQTRTIRRHGQGSHQLNQALSNIVNFVARGSLNPKVAASLRIQGRNQIERNTNTTGNYQSTRNDAQLNNNHLRHTSATSPTNHRAQFTFVSDNAVTSSTSSDMENSLDIRLSNEILSNDSTATYFSNTTGTSNASTLLPSSSSSSLSETTASSYRGKVSSQTLQFQGRLFERYSTASKNNNFTGHDEDGSDSEDIDLHENDTSNKFESNEAISELNPRDLDSDDDDESTRELASVVSAAASDAEMTTDDSDSMTSLDTQKSAELKRGNHPLLMDKLVSIKQPTNKINNSNNTKSFNNIRNTEGLLSIAIKTIKLVKRNQLLQQRLTQLQVETTEFIQSVLANPENRHFRENIEQKV